MAAASCSRPSISFVKTRTNRNHIIIPIVVTKRFLNQEGSIAISNKSLSICNCVKKHDEEHFVRWFREAWPYIRGHRGSTFVVVISGEIVSSPHLNGILQDISLLHGLGIKFILVPGTHIQIDKLLTERGKKGVYVGRYRVTDSDSLTAAMEASGSVRQTIEAKLSPGPPTLNLRRHGAHPRWQNLGVNVATGNFLAAKKRGVVEGVDYGYTGEVKKIEVEKIKERLDRDSVVIMSNLGYSSSGQVLNCNTYEVATACALAIKADKMICITDGDIFDGQDRPIRFMSLSDADRRIKNRAEQSQVAANYAKHFQFGDKLAALENQNQVDKRIENRAECIENRAGDFQLGSGFQNGVGFEKGNGLSGFAIGGEERFNKLNGFLSELAASAYVCQGGVQRVHIINGSKSGALLLELFTRDGVGTMIARDVYEGTRVAREEDLDGIKRLLRPLEDSGVLIRRSNQELIETLESFIVVEREGFIIACAALFPYFENKCAEVAAIAVSPECRGHGQGDKLLDYIEKKAISIGLQKLFLLTTRTADWFERRGFIECSIELLPRERRNKINISRGSKCYIKELQLEKSGGMIIRDYAVNKS